MIKPLNSAFLPLILSFIFALIFTGCPPKEVKKEEQIIPPPLSKEVKKTAPQEMSFRVASLDLKDFPRKIEQKDINGLAKKLKAQKIDIIAVENISRYPELKERLDVYEQLGKSLDMYQAFGENITLSGRQTGNALFSSYPLRSNENVTYKGLKSMNFESALFCLIDMGAKNLVVVSTRIPDKATESDEVLCLNTLMASARNYEDAPLIILSNILKPPQFEKLVDNTDPIEFTLLTREQKKTTQKFPLWHSIGELTLQNSNVIETDLGLALIAEYKLLEKSAP